MTIIVESKIEANRGWSERVTSKFRESKNIFWKSVNKKRKPQEKLEEVVKEENGGILYDNEQVVERWSGYFESLLNVEYDRKANLTSMGRGGVTSRRVGEQMDFENDEVQIAVSKLKNEKAAVEDGMAN
jgi:hypothetical protein